MEKKIKISTKKQMRKLIGFMKEYPGIARGDRTYGSSRALLVEKWEYFAKELNRLGPSRYGREWKRVWINYKGNLKRKLYRNRNKFDASCGDAEVPLTDLEETVIELMAFDKQSLTENNGATNTQPDLIALKNSNELHNIIKIESSEEDDDDEIEKQPAENHFAQHEAEMDAETEEEIELPPIEKVGVEDENRNPFAAESAADKVAGNATVVGSENKPPPLKRMHVNNTHTNPFEAELPAANETELEFLERSQATTQATILQTLKNIESIMQKDYELKQKIYELKVRKAKVIIEQKEVKMALAKAKLAKLKCEIG